MQLYVVGEIVGLTGVPTSSVVAGAHCVWHFIAPKPWTRVAGAASGASQSCAPGESGGMFVFQHPINLCCEAPPEDPSDISMPRIEIEVRWRDSYGRSDVGGYAVVHVPVAPGTHELSCRVWRPRGSLGDRFAAFFVGGRPALKDGSMRYGVESDLGDDDGKGGGIRLTRSAGGQRMTTAPAGEVHLRLSVCRKSGTSGDDAVIRRANDEADGGEGVSP